ncbi:Crp/Fnr family transcriptional regulator [Sphingomonas lenta]|uniref:Transcriptional regulator n=1 Tax=Sphingomonas lenta TaxID=1141887 RepID=A0A2A2SFK9_9SPHN|nr:Crp/Fnr family transcriptional regulator [Sphingomonas lenta]PAX08018.1 transcriptional regulator [Sphingomonas lenta]
MLEARRDEPTYDPLGCAACPVRDVAVCAGLEEVERRTLARLGRRRRFARGEVVFDAGDPDTACATLVTGALKLSRIDADGVERTVALIHAGGFLARLFATGVDCTATALADSELCLFTRGDVETAMRGSPGFMERILQATLEQLDASRALINLIARRETKARVAGLLLLFLRGGCEGEPRDGARVELPLSRGEMAGLLGTTIETVSRQFAQLEAEALIRRDGLHHVVVEDVGALAAVAG